MAGYILVNGVRVYQDQNKGMRFGKLTVIGPPFGKSKRVVCECDCGGMIATHLMSVVHGKTKSCGCIYGGNLTHGMTKTPEYNSWRAMCERCLKQQNKYYQYYGGKGIKIHPEWIGAGGFERWLSHIGKMPSAGLTQDRIDVHGNYEPGNVRWATRSEQMNNQSQRKAKTMTYRGVTRRIDEWAKMIGVKENTLRERLRRGNSPEYAMNHPNDAMRKDSSSVSCG